MPNVKICLRPSSRNVEARSVSAYAVLRPERSSRRKPRRASRLNATRPLALVMSNSPTNSTNAADGIPSVGSRQYVPSSDSSNRCGCAPDWMRGRKSPKP